MESLVTHVVVLDTSREIAENNETMLVADATSVENLAILLENVRLKKADATTVEKAVILRPTAQKRSNSKMILLVINVEKRATLHVIAKMKRMIVGLLVYPVTAAVKKVIWLKTVKVALKHVTIARNLVTKLEIVVKSFK